MSMGEATVKLAAFTQPTESWQRVCFWCRAFVAKRKITNDHVVPRARGGSLHFENVVRACKSCNEERGQLVGASDYYTRLATVTGPRAELHRKRGWAKWRVWIALRDKWVALERERLGHSPSAALEIPEPILDSRTESY